MKRTSQTSPSSHRAPLLWILLPWCLGFVLAAYLGVSVGHYGLVGLLLGAVGLMFWVVLARDRSEFWVVWKPWFFVLAVSLAVLWWMEDCDRHVTVHDWDGLPPRELQLVLEVRDLLRVSEANGRIWVEFEGHFLRHSGSAPNPRMLDRLQCHLLLPVGLGVVGVGDVVEARGVLYPPDSVFDSRFHFGKGAVLSIDARDRRVGLSVFRHFVLARVIKALEQGEPEGKPYAGYLQSMMTGDKRYLGYLEKQRIRNAGVMHFFAISGFHLSVVALICFSALQLLGVSRSASSAWMLVLCAGYVWLTGSPVSAQRAMLMLTTYFVAGWFVRKPNALAATMVAAWLILLVAPQQLFEPGFQLSFVVVVGIITQAVPMTRWLTSGKQSDFVETKRVQPMRMSERLRVGIRYFVGAFCVSWTAFWLSAPIVAAHFGQVPFVSIAINTILAPLFAIVMTAGFLSAVSGVCGLLFLSDFLNHGIWLVFGAIDPIIGISDQVRLTWSVHAHGWVAVVGTLVMLWIGCWFDLGKKQYRHGLLWIPFVSMGSLLISQWL